MNAFLDKTQIFTQRWWTVEDVMSNKDCLFVFGDNDLGKGKGGQAIIRGLSNTIGIPTKKLPRQIPGAYYSDDEFDENMLKIVSAYEKIIKRSKNYRIVYFPKDGFGTGLARMSEMCPKTFQAMNDLLKPIYSKIQD